MLLWIVIGLVCALVVALLLRPLLLPGRGASPRASYDIEVYRDQLREVDRDLERGLIDGADAEAARTEIERRLLAAAEPEDASPAPARGRPLLSVALVAVLVPAAATAVYLAVGRPNLPGQPFAARSTLPPGHKAAQARAAARLAALRAKVAKEPNKAENWAALGRFLLKRELYPGAVTAYRHAHTLAPEDPAIAAAYGEALVQAAKGIVTPRAQAVFRAVLKRQPRNPGARYYMGLADAQAGRTRKALEAWVRLEADAAKNAPWLPALRRQIEMLAKRAGADVAALRKRFGVTAARPRPRPKGPTKRDMDAARGMTPEQRMAMIRSMVQGLEDRLKEKPGDVAGWRRLGRSYSVLGRLDKAAWAYRKAATLAPRNTAILSDYAMVLLKRDRKGEALPPEFVAVIRRINALDGNNAVALYFLGMAEAQADNAAAALALWRRLLARLPKGAPVRADLERRIAALEARERKKKLP